LQSRPDDQCRRMVTKEGSRCSRQASSGGMGFCWQHVPVQRASDREKWKLRVEGAALAVSAADLLIKVVQIAVEHLHELFGPGDEQSRAKQRLQSNFPPSYPKRADSYVPGSRVDWKSLLRLYEEARRIAQAPESGDWQVLEQQFVVWFDNLNKYHKSKLLKAIEEQSE
jgi:hypothetical protein